MCEQANAVAGAIVSAVTADCQYVPMAGPFVWSVPYNFPTSDDGGMHNPAIGRGVYNGGESAMERFTRGVRSGKGYDWPV